MTISVWQIAKNMALYRADDMSGGGAVQVVAITPGKARQVNFLLEQVMYRVLKTARQQLLLQINRQKPGTRVDRLVTRHTVVPRT